MRNRMKGLLQEWVTQQAETSPDAIALAYNQEGVTYRELDEASNRLARLLKASGCVRGDRICFLIPKSPTAILAILGILKADCIHVPIDTASPAPRILRILQNCEPRLILAAGPVTGLLQEVVTCDWAFETGVVGWLDATPHSFPTSRVRFTRNDLDAHSEKPIEYANVEGDPAHILFTSGSTGMPKGVVITHSNVNHFVQWAVRYFEIDSTDRNSGHPPLHFDLSTFDIFGTFAAGAELHLVPAELNLIPHKLVAWMRSSELSQWFSVPSVLNYIARFDLVRSQDFPTLRRLLWCGEALPTPTLIYWMARLPHVRFTNLYGPTETTIASSYYTVPRIPTDPSEPIPIGQPCPGEDLLILDEALLPVPLGEVGHLYIGGVGLSPGYWRDPQKTQAAFRECAIPATPTMRVYKTGDLARRGQDGLVYFLGREDQQIKSRGYRIELGEIETAMQALGVLKDCAVVAIESGGFEGKTICCAYVGSTVPPIVATELRKRVSDVLPGYMIPARWMSLEQFPQNANGKVDRPKLRELFEQREKQVALSS